MHFWMGNVFMQNKELQFAYHGTNELDLINILFPGNVPETLKAWLVRERTIRVPAVKTRCLLGDSMAQTFKQKSNPLNSNEVYKNRGIFQGVEACKPHS